MGACSRIHVANHALSLSSLSHTHTHFLAPLQGRRIQGNRVERGRRRWRRYSSPLSFICQFLPQLTPINITCHAPPWSWCTCIPYERTLTWICAQKSDEAGPVKCITMSGFTCVWVCICVCISVCISVCVCNIMWWLDWGLDYSTSSSDCPGVAANSCQLESLQGERKCNEDVCVHVCGELQRLQGRM